ncbi:MAG TPA: hypothetical protein VEW28_09965 [Candidatus Kapabacteria bacterium]|nr:hypothetical protein [Candidatus Kapabacteria bacterium]
MPINENDKREEKKDKKYPNADPDHEESEFALTVVKWRSVHRRI